MVVCRVVVKAYIGVKPIKPIAMSLITLCILDRMYEVSGLFINFYTMSKPLNILFFFFCLKSVKVVIGITLHRMNVYIRLHEGGGHIFITVLLVWSLHRS